jgi:hypothetical protein
MTEFNDAPITMRIYRASGGQWCGRLLIGRNEIVLGAFQSPQEVAQFAEEIGLHSERIVVEAC